MYNIYALYLMNGKKLPFKVKRTTWGNFVITVDKIDNIVFSAKNWFCDAYTLSKNYNDLGYGSKGNYKFIGNCGSFQWQFADPTKNYNIELLPDAKPQHKKGLKFQKARKDYKCYYCKKIIKKGTEYERYSVRSAGKNNMKIDEVFCLGHRDKMRENYFNKKNEEIKYKELIEVWNKNIII